MTLLDESSKAGRWFLIITQFFIFVSVGGKLFTYVILMIGLGIVAIPAGLIASTLSKQND